MKLIKSIIGKGPIVESRSDFFKVPLGFIIIALFSISPVLIALAGAWITKLLTGQECLNEGSCFWAVVPWCCFYTLPIAFIFIIKFGRKSFREIQVLQKKNK